MTSCWRGSIWHCDGVGIRRLRFSRRAKSDRARCTLPVVTSVRVEPDCGQASDSAQAGFEPATEIDNVMGARSCLCVRALSAQKFIALLDQHFDCTGGYWG